MTSNLENQAKEVVLNRIAADLIKGTLNLDQFVCELNSQAYPEFLHKSGDLGYSLSVTDFNDSEEFLDLFLDWGGEAYFFDIKKTETGPAVFFLKSVAAKGKALQDEWREKLDRPRFEKLISSF